MEGSTGQAKRNGLRPAVAERDRRHMVLPTSAWVPEREGFVWHGLSEIEVPRNHKGMPRGVKFDKGLAGAGGFTDTMGTLSIVRTPY